MEKTPLDISALSKMTIADLTKKAKELKVEGISSLRKQDLIFKILHAQA